MIVCGFLYQLWASLTPKWEGGWKVTNVTSPVTVAISDGKRNKAVHINRLQHRIQPMESDATENSSIQQWRPPEVKHFIDETLTGPRHNVNPEELEDHLTTIVQELEDKLTLKGACVEQTIIDVV